MNIDNKITKSGTYEIQLMNFECAYIDLVIDFNDPRRPSLSIPLIWQGEGTFYRLFRVAYDVESLELVVAPNAALIDQNLIVLKRVCYATMVRVGFRKLIANLSSPMMFVRKLRYYLSGTANVALDYLGQAGVGEVEAYRHWQEIFEEGNAGSDGVVLFVYVVSKNHAAFESFLGQLENGEYGVDSSLLIIEIDEMRLENAFRRQAVQMGVQIQQYESAEFKLSVVIEYASLNSFDAITFVEQPGLFNKNAFAICLRELAMKPEISVVYGDSDLISSDGERSSPFFKPGWSPEYLLSCNYIGSACVFRVCDEVLSASREIQLPYSLSYALLLSLKSSVCDLQVSRIPLVLFHQKIRPELIEATNSNETKVVEQWLKNSGKQQKLETWETSSGDALRRVLYPVAEPPATVSVVIPTRDNPKMLQDAITAVLEADYPSVELIIIDNGSIHAEQLKLLATQSESSCVTIIRNQDSFNFSALINEARKVAKGEVLLLLNDDIKASDNQWLTEMVTLASQPEVGCVGALLVYPDSTVQHSGVVLGIRGDVEHAFRGFPEDAPVSGWRLQVRHEVSAVTAACLAVRATVFDQVGGLDETLAVAYNDIDFCLKVRQLGFRNVVTPHAKLIHYESATRGLDITPEKLERVSRERAYFLERWETGLDDDPFYSPHLSRTHANYEMRLLG